MTLADLTQEHTSRITGFTEQGESLSRLHAMGVIPGAEATLLRTAPLGDPMQIRIEGTLLSIRKHDAQQIRIELL
ncbi:ferrous iron transport protein A [Pseudomaricurvus alkylphenolicus]|jgi:ferrous iron transport protein A|uniref:FeoA family protein n=1 Tax=Pseudomaricurvus alkylphenolicus TaxID=1306991 RepID=UPI00141E8715|nr:FeoA family protein [Pseudomaricurvus alkylphenolicus]NIB40788.1 ferrous iron transport protein A [Pseudomaricurvus alkylphenolicus]